MAIAHWMHGCQWFVRIRPSSAKRSGLVDHGSFPRPRSTWWKSAVYTSDNDLSGMPNHLPTPFFKWRIPRLCVKSDVFSSPGRPKTGRSPAKCRFSESQITTVTTHCTHSFRKFSRADEYGRIVNRFFRPGAKGHSGSIGSASTLAHRHDVLTQASVSLLADRRRAV